MIRLFLLLSISKSQMFRKFFLPSILLVLVYWFWVSPELKVISAWVAIFLFWMMFLEDWFKAFTGWVLERILQKSTNKTWKSLLFWFTSATVMQSSSLVSLLTISFLSAELITLIQWIWIIFGANIGTTTWAWLIATLWMKINISLYAMPMLVFWIIFSFQKAKSLKWIGSILAWLGFLFLWIHYMKGWFEAFQSSINLIDYAIEWFLWILAYVWIWIIATIVMQSSHATIILVIAALATKQVTYDNALALVIWANVGTTITAIIGSFTSNINGKRLALSDVLFKTTTWLVFMVLLPFISSFIDSLWGLMWIASDNHTLKLALFHTLFNVSWILIVVPFMDMLVKVLSFVFSEKKLENSDNPIYLNKSVLDFPDTALVSLIKETNNLYNKSVDVILEAFGLTLNDVRNSSKNDLIAKVKPLDLEGIEKLYSLKIKNLYSEIIDFITNAQAENPKKYYNNFYKIKSINIKIVENIKYLIALQKNVVKYSKSANESIKNQYLDIVYDFVSLINQIEGLNQVKDEKEKLLSISRLELYVEKNDYLTNKHIDSLIRESKITHQMASSLINDTYYKNNIFKNFLDVSEIISNNQISYEITEPENIKIKKIDRLFNNILWISDKKIKLLSKKLYDKKRHLKGKLLTEKDKSNISYIKNEIEVIQYTLDKYTKNLIPQSSRS